MTRRAYIALFLTAAIALLQSLSQAQAQTPSPCPQRYVAIGLKEGTRAWPLNLVDKDALLTAFRVDFVARALVSHAPSNQFLATHMSVECAGGFQSDFIEMSARCLLRIAPLETGAIDIEVDRDQKVLAAYAWNDQMSGRVMCSLGGSPPAHPPYSELVSARAKRAKGARKIPVLTRFGCGADWAELQLEEGKPFWPLVELIERLDRSPHERLEYLRVEAGPYGQVWKLGIERAPEHSKKVLAPVSRWLDTQTVATARCSADVDMWRSAGFVQAATRCRFEGGLEVALDVHKIVLAAHAFDPYEPPRNPPVDCSLGGDRVVPADVATRIQHPLVEAALKFHSDPLSSPSFGFVTAREVALSFFSLQALEQLSGAPVFASGPHKSGFVRDEASFGHYNPKFVRWMIEHALPVVATRYLRAETNELYATRFKKIIRGLYFERLRLERPTEDYPHQNAEIAGAATLFWKRRQVDGTAPAFAELVDRIVEIYEPDLIARVRAFDDLGPLPMYEVLASDLPRSMTVVFAGDQLITLIDRKGERCTGELARTATAARDECCMAGEPPTNTGIYRFTPSCRAKDYLAIVPGDIKTLTVLDQKSVDARSIVELLPDESASAIGRTFRILYDNDRELPRLRRVRDEQNRVKLDWLYETQVHSVAEDVSKHCKATRLRALMELRCVTPSGDSWRILFTKGELIDLLRVEPDGYGAFRGQFLSPVASYKRGGRDLFVLDGGPVLIESNSVWIRKQRGAERYYGECDCYE